MIETRAVSNSRQYLAKGKRGVGLVKMYRTGKIQYILNLAKCTVQLYVLFKKSEKICAQVEVRSNRGRDREESRLKRLNRPDPRCM